MGEGTLLGATPKWTARAREYQDSSETVILMLPALTAQQSVSPLEDSLQELSVSSPSNMQGPPTPAVLLPATILPGATLKWTLRVTACREYGDCGTSPACSGATTTTTTTSTTTTTTTTTVAVDAACLADCEAACAAP